MANFLQKLQVIVRSGGAEAARFQLLRCIVRLVMPQYRLKWYCLDWWRDADFNAYLNRFDEADGLNIELRCLFVGFADQKRCRALEHSALGGIAGHIRDEPE